MSVNDIFFNAFGRLRSGWRLTIFLVSYFLLTASIITAAVVILSNLPVGFSPASFTSYILQFGISIFTAIFFGWLYGKIFEDLPFRALGIWLTKNWLKDLILGLLLGAASLCLAALVAFVFGGITFQMNRAHGTLAIALTLTTSLVIFIVGAVSEEVIFRGYPLQTLSRAKLFAGGAILTSFLFATMHNNNPNATTLSWFNTFLAGIWFAVAYFKTRTLWFPIGLHLAWNWFQGSILGINVSGLGELTTAPLMRATDLGPQWLTGGDYGIEGGAACTISLIVSTIAIYFLPALKPTEEMLALTGEEKPAGKSS